jgi:hypothetical protein
MIFFTIQGRCDTLNLDIFISCGKDLGRRDTYPTSQLTTCGTGILLVLDQLVQDLSITTGNVSPNQIRWLAHDTYC